MGNQEVCSAALRASTGVQSLDTCRAVDYRCLNDLLTSQPGRSAQVCEDTLHKWRRAGDPNELRLLDIRKAYLQIHIAAELQRFQTVLWQGKEYVMTRMGFRLSVATKFVDIIVRWVTHILPAVDNYVDDVMIPCQWCRRSCRTHAGVQFADEAC